MKQSLILAQFVILMILFVGITTNALALEKGKKKGKKAAKAKVTKVSPVLRAIAFLACAGKAKCMIAKFKTQKCKLSAWKAPTRAVALYQIGLKKKSVKLQHKANKSFKAAMKPIATCNITPKNMRTAFSKGLKIVGGKKAKKAAKKAKKAVKKAKKAKKAAKKAKKAVKKAAKKGKKAAKKGKKAAKKAAKKGKKAAKKAKKAKKAAYISIMASLKSLLKLC